MIAQESYRNNRKFPNIPSLSKHWCNEHQNPEFFSRDFMQNQLKFMTGGLSFGIIVHYGFNLEEIIEFFYS